MPELNKSPLNQENREESENSSKLSEASQLDKTKVSLIDIFNRPNEQSSRGVDNNGTSDSKTDAKNVKKVKEAKEEKKMADSKSDEPDIKQALSLLEQKHQDTLQWGNQLSRKLKTLDKKLHDCVESGKLTAEEAAELFEDAEHQGKEEVNSHPLTEYASIWDSEIANLKKYTHDAAIDEKVIAFQHLLKTGDESELIDLFEEFKHLKSDSIALTRAMLKAGEEYMPVHQELTQKGGIKKLSKYYQKALTEKQKEIDKLQQEILKYRHSNEYISSENYSLQDRAAKGLSQDNSLGSLLNQALSRR